MKKWFSRFALPLALAIGLMAVSAVVSTKVYGSKMLPTTMAVQRLQPFVTMNNQVDSTATNGVGGIVKYYVAKSTDTLKICDVVFIDTLNAVSKSTTLANYNKLAGVVIGGRSTSMQGSVSSSDCGSTAALPNRPVIVMRTGRYWVQVDTATGGLTAGGLIMPSTTTAGKVRAKSSVLDSIYRVLGRAVNGGAISTNVLAEISAR